jgi:orotidine-5'-phosphate decarboxylase
MGPQYPAMTPCELILALDVPSREAADAVLAEVCGTVKWVKIGLQLFAACGPEFVRTVADRGFSVFLDLKLHDIPNTVARAVESLNSLPIGMLTVHASGGREMLASANTAARPDLIVLGVTVLTSLDGPALAETGVVEDPEAQVVRLAKLAVSAGLRGLVCSPLEVAPLRRQLPAHVKLITPGIRPAGGSGNGDQKRVMTPADAVRAGSNYIVVGRPILMAKDRAAAAAAILHDLR